MLKAYKYRLCPTEQQIIKIHKHIGCARYVYNWALSTKIEEYTKNKKTLSQFDLCKLLVFLKKEEDKSWLQEVGAQTLQQVLDDLDKAYTNFFRKQNNFPKFKKKNKSTQSFSIPQHSQINFKTNTLYCLKFQEGIKINISRTFKGTIKKVTISKTKTNEYYASILVDTLDTIKEPKSIKEKTTIGLDLGIKDYVVLSNGTKIANPKFYSKYEKRIKFLHKQHSRKQKGSKNREKARLQLAKQYEKITQCRTDFLHKLTYRLTHENQVNTLIIENLGVSNMLQNHNLAKSIADCSWSEFVRQLEYKCGWYGINLLQIGRFEPSSKLCSSCGVINDTLSLSDRVWTCICGVEHDRDINAAINIKKIGLHHQNLIGKGIDTNGQIGQGLSELTLGESSRRKGARRTKKRKEPSVRKKEAQVKN